MDKHTRIVIFGPRPNITRLGGKHGFDVGVKLRDFVHDGVVERRVHVHVFDVVFHRQGNVCSALDNLVGKLFFLQEVLMDVEGAHAHRHIVIRKHPVVVVSRKIVGGTDMVQVEPAHTHTQFVYTRIQVHVENDSVEIHLDGDVFGAGNLEGSQGRANTFEFAFGEGIIRG